MKLLIVRNKTAQRTEAIVLLDRYRPFFRQVVCNSAGGIVLETFEPAGVIRVEDWIVDEVPPLKMHADYLNPELHEEAGIPNLVTTSLLTSRRFDALKLWISFQALGRSKLGAMIDRTIALADHAAQIIRRTPQLELVCEPQLSTVVFRYLPSANKVDADLVNVRIRQTLLERGLAVVGHTRVHNRQCLKFTCMNPTATEADLETLLGMIIEEGEVKEND